MQTFFADKVNRAKHAFNIAQKKARVNGLFGHALPVVELDNEQLVDWLAREQFATFWVTNVFSDFFVFVHFHEIHCGNSGFERFHDALLVFRAFANFDDLTRFYLVARDVDFFAVNHDLSVVNKLAGTTARIRETEAVYQVVKTGLKHDQEIFACCAGFTACLLVCVEELFFCQLVRVADSLFFLQLNTVVRQFRTTAFSVLSWGVITTCQFLSCSQDGETETTGLFPSASCVS